MVPLCLKFGAIPTIIYKVTAFGKNSTRHFSLIGRHLESVSRTIPVFKDTLAHSAHLGHFRRLPPASDIRLGRNGQFWDICDAAEGRHSAR